MKPKKVPLRMCVGCREMKPKRELMRIVRSPEGQISLDPVGKKPGRGAYVCPDAACLKKAQKTKGLERAFETRIDETVFMELESALEKTDAKATIGAVGAPESRPLPRIGEKHQKENKETK